ncbi:MAG: hypothetical protein HQL06_10055 [Nitrospirae bacterium]|nr:hypothetical protein [Nitrospirota bacterium]
MPLGYCCQSDNCLATAGRRTQYSAFFRQDSVQSFFLMWVQLACKGKRHGLKLRGLIVYLEGYSIAVQNSHKLIDKSTRDYNIAVHIPVIHQLRLNIPYIAVILYRVLILRIRYCQSPLDGIQYGSW